jgi:V-type H+-transporting ATPase subunit a
MTYRSQPMTHYQLIIPREISWEVVNYLGQIERVHLEDISNPSNRPFYSQVKRCD